MIIHKFKCPEVELFLNGCLPQQINSYFFKNKKNFAVNGSFLFLKKNNIPCDYIIGDLDSISNVDDITNVKINILKKTNQEHTDFEKALNFLYKKKHFNVNVWGSSGKEQDHFLGNLSSALKYKNYLSIIFYDKYHIYFFLKKKTEIVVKKNEKISLYPFPIAHGIKTAGLAYSLNNETLKIGERIGIRNYSILKNINITYKTGNLLIFIENKLKNLYL